MPMTSSTSPLHVRWLGSVPYTDALAIQDSIFRHGTDNRLLLLEHPHVFTYGPSAELEKIASSIFGVDRVFEISDLSSALDRAVKDAHRPLSEETIGIIVTGSVVTVGEARAYLRKKFSK